VNERKTKTFKGNHKKFTKFLNRRGEYEKEPESGFREEGLSRLAIADIGFCWGLMGSSSFGEGSGFGGGGGVH